MAKLSSRFPGFLKSTWLFDGRLLTLGRRPISLLAFVLVGLAIAWGLLPWEWSTIDDPGHVLRLSNRMKELGPILGPARYAIDQFQIDLSWGLFRPSYWLYPSLVYWSSPSFVHVVRFLLLSLAIIGPLAFMRRKGSTPLVTIAAALVLIISASALTRGLFFLSLQELSGAGLVGAGLLAKGSRARTGFWLAAMWFKAPFGWLLLGQALELWRSGHRRHAAFNLSVWLASTVMSYIFAHFGSYTQRYFRGSLYGVVDAVWQNLPNLMEVPTAALLLSVIWWLLLSFSRLHLRPEVLTFGIAFAGYSGQMLLWEVSSYYFGPILYLGGVALVLAFSLTTSAPRRLATLGLGLPAVLALWTTGTALLGGFEANRAIIDAGKCLQIVGPGQFTLEGDILNVTTDEGAVRLREIQEINQSGWTGQLERIEDYQSLGPTTAEFRLFLGNGSDFPDGLVCDEGLAKVAVIAAR